MENSTQPSPDLESPHPWYWATRMIIAVITVIGNGVVIAVISCSRRLRNQPNMFILSLAIADFSVGLFITPTGFICLRLVQCDPRIQAVFFNALLHASMANLLTLTIDRLLAVTYPLRYRTLVTGFRMAVGVAAAWVIPFVVCAVRLAWLYSDRESTRNVEKVYKPFMDVALGALPCVIIVTSYAYILLTVHKIHVQTKSLIAHVRFNGNNSRINLARERESRSPLIKSSIRVLGVVVAFFVVCYTYNMYVSFCSVYSLCVVSQITKDVSLILIFANSAVNFFVYAFLKTDFRETLNASLLGIFQYCFRV
ncbi:histamine H2 receptor [Nematostella vectensis]|uniref:histamine H2 receptor n=1 Tax=Nematostella vectensis TaxID=45351 RepID=UPI002077197D|nr:histamine H2 receptor [Nematostella vectensis]